MLLAIHSLMWAAMAGEPAPAPARPAPPPRCPVGQACGDRCIDWTAVCTETLRATLGMPPPTVTAAGPEAPKGATLLHLPELHDAGAPGMSAGAPPWCTEPRADGLGADRLPIECVPYYKLGLPAGATTAEGQACPIDRRCGGRCLAETEVCADAPGVEPAPAGPAQGLTPQPVWR